MKRYFLLAACLFLLSLPVLADVTYNYTGNHYTTVDGNFTTAMSVHGYIVLSSPLDANLSLSTISPVTWYFEDGLTNFNAPDPQFRGLFGDTFQLSTDGFGNITGWHFTLEVQPGSLSIPWGLVSDGATGDSAGEFELADPFHPSVSHGSTSTPGTWAGADTAVPEPSSLVLLFSGLAAVFRIRLRQNNGR